MKIGFFAIGIANLARPELITAVATNAERLNFATVWAPEHVVFLERFASRYPYSRGENIPIPTDTPLLNPFLALTYAAARTSRIRLATGICLVPEYNPVLLAKICATLDYLSGGRLALGIGIGWLQEEFKALGIPWEHRSRRENADSCRWSNRSRVETRGLVRRRMVRLQPHTGRNRTSDKPSAAIAGGEWPSIRTIRIRGRAYRIRNPRRPQALSRRRCRRARPYTGVPASARERGRHREAARRTRAELGRSGGKALSA
jgi:Luciferase-like monooxygenase